MGRRQVRNRLHLRCQGPERQAEQGRNRGTGRKGVTAEARQGNPGLGGRGGAGVEESVRRSKEKGRSRRRGLLAAKFPSERPRASCPAFDHAAKRGSNALASCGAVRRSRAQTHAGLPCKRICTTQWTMLVILTSSRAACVFIMIVKWVNQ
eukprot:5429964-Pleurochrysis_carterae.AAC.3